MSTEHIDIRQHILDTAMPIILGKGFSAVGLNEILTAADVPKGSFYHYFKSKEAFGEALLEYYFSAYLTRLETLLSETGQSAAQHLMRYWTAWQESQSHAGPAGKCLAVKLGAEVCDLSESMRAALEHGTRQIIDRLAQTLREGALDGSLPSSLDADQVALNLYNLWLGASLLGKIRHDASAFEAARALTAHILEITGPD